MESFTKCDTLGIESLISCCPDADMSLLNVFAPAQKYSL